MRITLRISVPEALDHSGNETTLTVSSISEFERAVYALIDRFPTRPCRVRAFDVTGTRIADEVVDEHPAEGEDLDDFFCNVEIAFDEHQARSADEPQSVVRPDLILDATHEDANWLRWKRKEGPTSPDGRDDAKGGHDRGDD